MRVDKCRDCGAAVVWLPHVSTGKKVMIDAEPVRFGGRVVVEANGSGGHHYRIVKKGEATRQGTRHQMHMVTCGKGKKPAAPAEPAAPAPTSRPCPFAGCPHRLGLDLAEFACPSHWRALPPDLRDEVYAATGEWNRGEIDDAELRRRQRDIVVKACEPVTA